MSRVLRLIARLFVILFGYWLAVVAASLFIMIAPLVSVGSESSTFDALVEPVVWGTAVLSVAVSYYAFAPSALAILAVEILQRRDCLSYAAAGLAVAFAVVQFVIDESGLVVRSGNWGDLALLLGAGVAGGLAYWLVAGRSSGDWRGKPASISSEPSES